MLFNNRELKTGAFSALIKLYTGESPVITRMNDYNQIDFTPSQVKTIHAKLDEAHRGDPGEVRLNVKPIFLPYYLKKYAPPILGLIGAGFLLGRLSKG